MISFLSLFLTVKCQSGWKNAATNVFLFILQSNLSFNVQPISRPFRATSQNLLEDRFLLFLFYQLINEMQHNISIFFISLFWDCHYSTNVPLLRCNHFMRISDRRKQIRLINSSNINREVERGIDAWVEG